jgi:hypothetical protein
MWQVIGSGECGERGTVTHTNSTEKSEVVLSWSPLNQFRGQATFRATSVQDNRYLRK